MDSQRHGVQEAGGGQRCSMQRRGPGGEKSNPARRQPLNSPTYHGAAGGEKARRAGVKARSC